MNQRSLLAETWSAYISLVSLILAVASLWDILFQVGPWWP